MEIIAIIPARGGSKRLPRKNIKLLAGEPLISYSIKAALSSRMLNRVVVSTDDEEISEISSKFGAEVPFLRPERFARDKYTSFSVIKHALSFLKKKENYKPDFVVLIQPTSPFVLGDDIDKAINTMIRTNANSCISVCSVGERPDWMVTFSKKKADFVKPILVKKESDKLGKLDIFRVNGAVYVTRKSVLEKGKIIDFENCSAIVMPKERSVDIDTEFDFRVAEAFMEDCIRY